MSTPALGERILDIAQAHRETVIELDRISDHNPVVTGAARKKPASSFAPYQRRAFRISLTARVEHLAATRRFNATFPAMAVDVERLQVDDIGNWLRTWEFMEAGLRRWSSGRLSQIDGRSRISDRMAV